MEKLWKIKDSCDPGLVSKLTEALNIDPMLVRLLVQRGITTYDEAKAFFRPQLTDLYDPFLMKDMDLAADRVKKAITSKERILVYGDYDVDGTTSVALVYSFLQNYYTNIDFYIPDRYSEGYGISYKGIDYAKTTGCGLIIALDCGIKSIEKVNYASGLGIDFIICDHHNPEETLPRAVACLDSKRADCLYPDKNLSGCGVGFKLMQALCLVMNYDQNVLFEYLDLVAVSIASDIVPIIGENRILTYYGLKKLNSNPSVGLRSILNVAQVEEQKPLTITDIVFKIGPRINAAGRIKSGRDAVSLLIADDPELAGILSSDMNDCNDERRRMDSKITEEALKLLQQDERVDKRYSTVLYQSDWHKGVIGIVASRLTEYYYRPTVVLTQSNGLATGSARSVDGFDLYKAIEHCSHLLENFGGHLYAAGLTLKCENVPEFARMFEEYVEANITPDQLIPTVEIDAEIQLSKITPKFFNILNQFQPFGPGNMKPVFVTGRVYDNNGNSRLVGKDGAAKHLKVDLLERQTGTTIQGIGFFMADKYPLLQSGNAVDVCYTIEENCFNDKTTLQLQLRDIKMSDF